MRNTLWILLSMALSLCSAAAQGPGDGWLRLSRPQIMRHFAVASAPASPNDAGQPEDVARLQSEGDTVWIATNEKPAFRLVMAGRGDKVHSLRLFIPLVNMSSQERDEALRRAKAFFSAEFADWAGAAEWPSQSLEAAWNASAKAMETRSFANDAMVVRKTIGGRAASTFGVVPDFIVYAVTSRKTCIPTMTSSPGPKDSPFQRAVC
jgi:hypothetical protein